MRALEAICETFVEGAAAQGVPEAAEEAIRTLLTRRERRRLRLLLALWPRGFGSWSRRRRERRLRAWRDSRLRLRRTGFEALRKAALAHAYMLPGRWEAIGYPGPPGPLADAPPPAFASHVPQGDLELACDVCVVGSGAGGGVAAAVLAQAGLEVVVLEAGPHRDEVSFDGAELEGLRRLYVRGGAAATDDQGVALVAGRCVGGGTLVNFTTSFRTPDEVREEWTALGFPGGDDFGRSLDAVCARIDVNTEHNRPSRRDELMARGLRELGWHVDAMPRNVVGCEQGVRCGFCGYGCPFGAKRSTLRTWLADAVAAGARVVAETRAQRVVVERGAARGVQARSGRHSVRVRARAVVAACGAIETPALLLRSGLRNRNVGARLRLHPATAAWGLFDEEVRPWEGTVQALYSDELLRLDGDYGVRFETIPFHPALLSCALPWESASQHAALMAELPRLSGVGVLLRDRGSGRVTTARDGEPVVRYRLDEGDGARLRAGVEGATRILRAAGARRVLPADPRERPAGGFGAGRGDLYSFHLMGSARMTASPGTGAADPDGRTWEVPNVVVADGSTFPTASGVNPMVTIEAVAHLNAQKLAASLN